MQPVEFHADNLLLYAPNWLGDAVMCIPALQAWRKANPHSRVTVLTKPGLAALWSLCPCADAVVTVPPGNHGTFAAAREARGRGHDAALSVPNSFRSALVPWLARIPRRRGCAMHARSLLLTERIPRASMALGHQACADFDLFGLPRPASPADIPTPLLDIPPDAIAAARASAFADTGPDDAAKNGAPLFALIPGAARGPSKRWPAKYFIAAAKIILAEVPDARFAICGAKNEAGTCAEVAAGLPRERVADMAGKTDLRGLAALLAACDGVCCNDSGGMHLAAAVGTPLAAVFGITDPVRTGPLGRSSRVVTRGDVRHDVAIARESAEAAAVLESIAPERVAAALLEVRRK